MVQIHISTVLRKMLEQLIDTTVKNRDLAEKVYKQAKKEGLSDRDLRTVMHVFLNKRGLSERQVMRLMPDSLKLSHRVAAGRKGGLANRQSATPALPESPDQPASDISAGVADLQAQIDHLQEQLKPFSTTMLLEIRQELVPVNLRVDPISREVLSASVDLKRARELNTT